MNTSSFGCDACDCARKPRDMKDLMNKTLARAYCKYSDCGNSHQRFHQWYWCFMYLSEYNQISYKLNKKELTMTASVKLERAHNYYGWGCCLTNSKDNDCQKQFCHKFKVPKSHWIEHTGLDVNDYYKKALPTNEPNTLYYGGYCFVRENKSKQIVKVITVKPVRLCQSHICQCGIFSKSRNKNVCKMCKRFPKRKQIVSFIGFGPYMYFRQEVLPELSNLIYMLLLRCL